MEDKNVAIHHRGKKRTKELISRPYSDEAASILGKMVSKEYETEKELGFDMKDIESIKNFKLDYTPIGDNLLVKPINKSEVILMEANTKTGYYMVIEVSPEVSRPLYKGDIILLGGPHMPSVPMVNRKIKGITLMECSAFGIAGIYISSDEYRERVTKHQASFVEEDRIPLEKEKE